jgi:hypothetical protein
MIDQAIYKTHTNVVEILESKDAYDAQGDVVVLDMVLVDVEVVRLQAEYDALEYSRNRQAEYPTALELIVALYDTDDKSAIEAKRASVKLKYPKPS